MHLHVYACTTHHSEYPQYKAGVREIALISFTRAEHHFKFVLFYRLLTISVGISSLAKIDSFVCIKGTLQDN